MANKQRLLVLLLQLSPILFLASVYSSSSSNASEAIEPREDEEAEDKRPSVKKWFNSLISPNSQNSKKSMPPSAPSSYNSSVPYQLASNPSKPYPVPVVAMPVPMASPYYPYPMSYPAVPFMAYPYQHSNLATSRSPLLSLPVSPTELMSPNTVYAKDRFPFYAHSYAHPGMYLPPQATHPPYAYDSRGFAYAVPVVPYLKRYYRHNGSRYKSSKLRPSKHSKYEDKSQPMVEPGSEKETEQIGGVESRQRETLSPILEPSDTSEPFEEEYTNEPSQENYDSEPTLSAK